MKSIILAAGEGSRLRPLTVDVPKCMVQYDDQCIIDYILNAMEGCGIFNNIVVNGYQRETLVRHLSNRNVGFFTNESYASTNMVYTLFCAEKELDDDIIISYADIIYQPDIINQLVGSTADIACVVDLRWKELWEQRMENPLADAESMKINDDGNVTELGKRTKSYADVQGQYMGLIKISRKVIGDVVKFYHSIDQSQIYDGKDFNNMYMTSFLQLIIDQLMPIRAEKINGGWLEIDCINDLRCKMV